MAFQHRGAKSLRLSRENGKKGALVFTHREEHTVVGPPGLRKALGMCIICYWVMSHDRGQGGRN